MRTDSRTRLVPATLVMLALSAIAMLHTTVDAGTETPASFTIDAVAGATVASDGGAYVDYRLIDGGATPICVDSLIHPTGSIFNRLNREISEGWRCGGDNSAGGAARNFIIAVDNPIACFELSEYGVGLTNSAGTASWSTGACVLTHVDSPRIRVDKTFGSRITKTKLAFLIKMLVAPEGHGGFEIQPVGSAQVTTSGAARVVSYQSDANLVKFVAGSKPTAVPGADFLLNFRITFFPGLPQ